jgi:hypothetical protein
MSDKLTLSTQTPVSLIALLSVFAALVFPPAGIVMGNIAMNQIRAQDGRGFGWAVTGTVLGWVGTVADLGLLVTLLVLIYTGTTN